MALINGTKSTLSVNTFRKIISRDEVSQLKKTINVGVFGHAESGKSTLLGHLLYKLQVFTSKELNKSIKDSKTLGKPTLSFAWLLDEMDEERKMSMTMETSELPVKYIKKSWRLSV